MSDVDTLACPLQANSFIVYSTYTISLYSELTCHRYRWPSARILNLNSRMTVGDVLSLSLSAQKTEII